MISRFFIDRPIFASVLSIIITLAGALAMFALPIAQYPPIAPPTVQVSCTYPGASARTVADTVAAPIEQQVNGVEGMLYMSSQCGNDGSYNLTVTFDLGSDLNIALVMVQNRVSLAMPQLPESVQKQGLTIKKKSPNILLVIDFFSPDGRYDDIYLSNYATIFVKDEIFRLEGVGDINYLGERDYSIRAWLDPQKLASRNISASDVSNAIKNQNLAAAPGQLGQQPVPAGEAFQLPTDTLGRLTWPEQFGDIIVKSVPGGSRSETSRMVRLKDVARVEMGAANYNQMAVVDGMPAVALAIYQLPGTNALDVANRVQAKMKELKQRFPQGLEYGIYYDTTPFIRESVEDVVKTLLEAVALVAIVVLVFLQNWRAALIPLIAVPVAIIGTFAIMKVIGFSLNNISLFGLVLAIGIVVDDAIVVVENVERWLQQGLPPREAARNAMDEVTGPVVAVAVVLCAVFIPCAFITGITGQFFRQFAVTIAVSTVFSALNSLTLSPALASILLQAHGGTQRRDPIAFLLNLLLGWFFKLFNWGFAHATNAYAWTVGVTLRVFVIALLLYGGLLGVTGWLFSLVSGRLHTPAGPGLAAGQRATARFVVGAANPGSHAQDRQDCPGDAWGGPHHRSVRRVDPAHVEQLQFRFDVRGSGRIRQAARARFARQRNPVEAAPRILGEDSRCRGRRLQRSARAGNRRRQRVQADGRGSRLPRDAKLADPGRSPDREDPRRARLHHGRHAIPGQHAHAVHGHRSRQGALARSHAR